MDQPTAAVIGAGVSGLTAAYILSKTHQVTLFETDTRLGGHAHTHSLTASNGREYRVDSGFIVHNDRTYPHLLRLFAELGIETQATEMSMSINCADCGLSFAGGRGLKGVLAQPWRVLDPRFVKMLVDIPRFHRAARAVLENEGPELTWGEFLKHGGWSKYFINHFALPLVSTVWSSDDDNALQYPARHLFAFLNNHGMLTVKGSPTWRTVVGGSASYVSAIEDRLESIQRGSAVTAVVRHDRGVDVTTQSATVQTFDKAVIATHADQALAIVADASPEEKNDLAAIGYSLNHTVLHTDRSHLPKPRGARASWNNATKCKNPNTGGVAVSYWMNKLQALDSPETYVVTLNPDRPIAEDAVIARMDYTHPIFTPAAIDAAVRLRMGGGERLAFAGAHLGWGFHEDGCRSGVEAAAKLGATW